MFDNADTTSKYAQQSVLAMMWIDRERERLEKILELQGYVLVGEIHDERIWEKPQEPSPK